MSDIKPAFNNSHYDVIIIGGGIIGSSIAYFLSANKNFKGDVLVIEKSPNHFESSTGLSVGGIRQQFSTPENIEISKYGAEFIKNANNHLSVDGEKPYIPFTESGYLFLSSEKGKSTLQKNFNLQKKHNAEIVYLSDKELKIRFPWLNVDDLAGGCLGLENEGYTDPYCFLRGFKNKAKSLGAIFLKDEVISLSQKSDNISHVKVKSGKSYSCGYLVNASGPRASEIAGMAGINLPVYPRKRFVYSFVCKEKIPKCPMVIDPSGIYFRSDGNKYLCGVSPPADQDPDTLDLDVDYSLFDEVIWPTLAQRVKYFDAIRRDHSWAGHYAFNIFDQNAILGKHPNLKNFLFANGFSGHGLQQAPAVGRAINELICYGSYQTLDLNRFSFDRIKTGKFVKEENVV